MKKNLVFWGVFLGREGVVKSPLNKVAGLKETPKKEFSCEICEIFKNIGFDWHRMFVSKISIAILLPQVY